jgi:hypothetical protein
MIDALKLLRDFLLADAGYVAVVTGGTYAGRNVPPVGYDPGDGPCTVFDVRGGRPDYDDALLMPSVQFKCYGSSEVEANACYRALYDALHDATGEHVLHAEVETIGQTLEEPETGWFFVVSHFSVTFRQI